MPELTINDALPVTALNATDRLMGLRGPFTAPTFGLPIRLDASVIATADQLATVASTAATNLAATASGINVNVSANASAITALQAADTAIVAVNTTQTGNIATNASAISALSATVAGLSIPAASSATPVVDSVAGAAGAATVWARGDHSHPLPAVAATTPARALNSAGFQPNATKACFVSYTVSISCALTLSGGQTGTVELRSDGASTPTAVRTLATNTNSGTLIVGLAITNAQTCQLSAFVPAGHYVRLVSSGTATITLAANQVEVAIG